MTSRPPNHTREANQLRWGFVLAIVALGLLVLFLVWTVVKNWGREELSDPRLREAIAVAPVKKRPLPPTAPAALEPNDENPGVEIFGKVFLQGTPPPERIIALDPRSETNWLGPKTTRHFVVDSRGGLANVFVYVKGGLEEKKFAIPTDIKTIEVAHGLFEPYIFGIQRAQKLKVVNHDSLRHTVNISFSPNQRGPGYPIRPSQETPVFTSPTNEEFCAIGCETHALWEAAYGGMFKHPFFAVTAADGSFRFPERLPPGRYVIAALHHKAKEITKELTIENDEQRREIIFTLNVSGTGDLSARGISTNSLANNSTSVGSESAVVDAINNLETQNAPAGSAGGGRVALATINGTVFIEGQPPPEKMIEMDATCGRLHPKPVTTRHYVVGTNGGLANVFVYLTGSPLQTVASISPEKPLLDQVNCMFEPYVLGVMVNQPFRIRNSDTIFHSVHATPKINAGFNVAQQPETETEQSFTNPEVLVRLKCDMHNWMFAYVGVSDNPCFAVTDNNGHYSIPNVPPGEYTMIAFHQKSHTASGKGVERRVTVEGPGKMTLNFKVRAIR